MLIGRSRIINCILIKKFFLNDGESILIDTFLMIPQNGDKFILYDVFFEFWIEIKLFDSILELNSDERFVSKYLYDIPVKWILKRINVNESIFLM
jgi:hypothetical protein